MIRPLKKVIIFAGLSADALALLLRRAQQDRFRAGAVVVREGEPGNQFFLIRSGQVRVCKRFGQADEVELARLGAGEFFGEMCLFETLPRSATVQASKVASVITLPALAFYDLYHAMPSEYSLLMLNIARDLSRRLRHLDEVYTARA